MYRVHQGQLEVFLVHPGGPYFERRDEGVWTIPKGEPEPNESLLEAARREFGEETGLEPQGEEVGLMELGQVRQKGGKLVHAWAFRTTREDTPPVCSNTFSLEWPPRSGRMQAFPEIDRAEFFCLAEARRKLNPAQVAFIDRLSAALE